MQRWVVVVSIPAGSIGGPLRAICKFGYGISLGNRRSGGRRAIGSSVFGADMKGEGL